MAKQKLLTAVGILCFLAAEHSLYAAPPAIKEFSSEGGRTQNKDNPEDTMYLVKPGDKITFSVKAEGAHKYQWRVNKKVREKVSGGSFTWTVPDEKGIWEIKLKVTGDGAEAHQEWVVSTLDKQKAPVIFDYFTDNKRSGKRDTDPWGRPLPQWSGNAEIGKGLMDGKASLNTKCAVAYGTWRFKFRWTVKPTAPQSNGATLYFARRKRGGHYCITMQPAENSWYASVPGGPKWVQMSHPEIASCPSHVCVRDMNWHDVRVIRTKGGWMYAWCDGEHYQESLYCENSIRQSDSVLLAVAKAQMDCVEVYDKRYLWPSGIRYGEYIDYWPRKGPVNRKGIVVNGHGVRLKDIAEAINNPSMFRYDPAKKEAVCYEDLVLKMGSELVIDNETLIMHCNKDGEHHIRVKNGSSLILNKAAIKSANKHYYLWAFTSPARRGKFQVKGVSSSTTVNFNGRFIARDSLISNCGNLFLDCPKELVLNNCRLIDLVEVDHGVYKPRMIERGGVPFARGKKGLWFWNRLPIHGFQVKNCIIKGRDGKPLAVKFLGGDQVSQLNIYDTVFDGATVKASKAHRFLGWIGTCPKDVNPCISSTVSLVNCKFADAEAVSDMATIYPKYYLDVHVVDEAGRPVSGAKVKVINEIDQAVKSENLLEKKEWFSGKLTFGNFKNWMDVNDMEVTETTKDGHTPLPEDKGHSLVITDRQITKDKSTNYTYSILVEKKGIKAGISGIDPDEGWFRKQPGKYQKTVRIVLKDDKTPPVISDMDCKTTGDLATISWKTDKPCSGQIRYGTDSSNLGKIRKTRMAQRQHRVEIRTKANIKHFFRISSKDIVDNSSQSKVHEFVLKPRVSKDPSWWNSHWRYRKPVISKGDTKVKGDFQVRLEMDYDQDMQRNFSDLRFVYHGKGGKPALLDHWIEHVAKGQKAVVWLNVPESRASGIYLYYGNPEAAGIGEPKKVFAFLEDFEGDAGWKIEKKVSTGKVEAGVKEDFAFSGKKSLSIRNPVYFRGNAKASRTLSMEEGSYLIGCYTRHDADKNANLCGRRSSFQYYDGKKWTTLFSEGLCFANKHDWRLQEKVIKGRIEGLRIHFQCLGGRRYMWYDLVKVARLSPGCTFTIGDKEMGK